MQSHEIIVPPQELNAAVQQGQRKGWQLIETIQQGDGNFLLRFQPQQAFQAGYGMQRKGVNPDLAWLELLGLLGFLGIGYLAADRVSDGVLRLIGFIIFSVVGWAIVVGLSFVLIGLCLIPVMIGLQVGIPIWSAVTLKRELEAQSMRV